MPRWNTVAILGVGLLGGSIGLALRERQLAHEVIGIGRRANSLRKARDRGAVTSTTTQLARGVAEAELVLICTPVESIVPAALEASRYCGTGCLLTDVGSTKQQIVRRLDEALRGHPKGVQFVGSHPLAGSEKAGPEHARSDLFQDRLVVVTPSRSTPSQAVSATEELWQSLGARVMRQTPEAHDAAVAAISHLPHLVASVLAAATPADCLPLAASGWLDTTRIAAGDVELWRQILLDNREHVLKSLGKFEKVLDSFRDALEKGQQDQLVRLLEVGKRHRDAVGN